MAYKDEDGCPTKAGQGRAAEGAPARAQRTFTIVPRSSAAIRPESYNILNQLALTLKANPDIKHIRIEGHTDSDGPADYNKRLSQQRPTPCASI